MTEQQSLSEHSKGLFTALASFRLRASQVVLVVKNPPANAGDARDVGSFPGSGRSPGEGNGNPLQYSCLENPMVRGAWRATVHGVPKSQTQLSTHACTGFIAEIGQEKPLPTPNFWYS